jgi:hypothetical protein
MGVWESYMVTHADRSETLQWEKRVLDIKEKLR